MWYRMMVIAFFTNGLAAFGARVLNGLGLGQTHAFLYLLFVYLGGGLLAAVVFFRKHCLLHGREVLLGALMGLFSSVGWILLTTALAKGMPGYLAFPVAGGGNLSIVAAVGVLIFKERLSGFGYLGIVCGVTGIAVLSTM